MQGARRGAYRIDDTASADGFVALGIAMGLNRPTFLLHREDSTVPTNLRWLTGADVGASAAAACIILRRKLKALTKSGPHVRDVEYDVYQRTIHIDCIPTDPTVRSWEWWLQTEPPAMQGLPPADYGSKP